MVKKHSQILLTALFGLDVLVTAGAWVMSFFLRFYALPFNQSLPLGADGEPIRAALTIYLQALPVVLFLGLIVYRYAGLYRPRRQGAVLVEVWDIFAANVVLFLFLTAFANYFARILMPTGGFEGQLVYSRWVMLLFPVVNCVSMVIGRCAMRMLMRRLREAGYNQRHALIVGAGKLGHTVGETISRNPWTGISVVGYLADTPEKLGETVADGQVIGVYGEVAEKVKQHNLDQVFLAIPWHHMSYMEDIVKQLSQDMVDVRIVPDMRGFMTLNAGVSEFDGLAVISLRESPLVGWNLLLKRMTDILLSLMALAVFAVPMAIVALLIKITSSGPVFYRQERMGLDGKLFSMLKFRSMRVDAEVESGAVWAATEDPRRTWLGTLLRKSSLDELPQFFNVLMGAMSIVGPRPERPVFIERFRKVIPKYMLRHKMKAGITGWAQINGWRGNTSLRKRIQYDLYYIENWSIWFDLRIMAMTVFRGLFAKNAY